MKHIGKPAQGEAYPYAQQYIDQLEGNDLLATLEKVHDHTWKLLGNLTIDPNFRYAPNKWSIKELVVHLTDTERILCFRALSFARGEQAELPSFDENSYAKHSRANQREFHDIMREFDAVRAATKQLYLGFDEKALDQRGHSYKAQISVRALGWFIAGHELHHAKVLQERYL